MLLLLKLLLTQKLSELNNGRQNVQLNMKLKKPESKQSRRL